MAWSGWRACQYGRITTRGRSWRSTRDDFDAIFERVCNGAVGQVERLAPAHAENARGFFGFARTFFGGAAGSGFALGQIENGGAQAARGHAQQGAAAGLLHVVAMSGDGQHIGRLHIGIVSGGHRISRRCCRRRSSASM